MPIRNEADRYLECALVHLCRGVDSITVFDDQSDDDSVALAKVYADHVIVRPKGVPSFLEHEGGFRQAAFDAFQEAVSPAPGDWVLAIDADEILLPEGTSCDAPPPESIATTVGRANERGMVGIELQIPEVFDWDDRVFMGRTVRRPMVRVDGYWGSIRGPRLFAWRPDGTFRDRPMGSGSEPTYVIAGPILRGASTTVLLHLGYAHLADRQAKYQRYSSMAHGHADAHIESIVTPPALEMWPRAVDVWRGVRQPT